MGLIFSVWRLGPSDPVGPFDFTIRMLPEGSGLLFFSFAAWTSDGRPSGGPFQLSHPDGPPEGGSHPGGSKLFFGLAIRMAAHPVGPSDPVGPFNFTFRMGSRKVGAIRWV